ncbi:hypothetical protein [Erwinia sorbitola]|uniref:HEAT repeat domain-containing protein n=1 Tax=Erwinia sorbitola TaxID=2681984 RepID=A0ABW9RHB3_9GAMM|nr:hypothetical protein [Erwinia sorbitola]MTD29421.1 hypothetical protein [Erwinia sorbitola]
MTTKNIYSEEWLSVKEAENKFLSAKYYFRQSHDFFEQLLLAVNSLSEQGAALRFIRDEEFDDSELEKLTPIIISIAVDGNVNNVPFAREVLIKYVANDIIKNKLTSMLGEFLNSHDEYIYRRLAELLLFLNYNELRGKLMEECKGNKDENIAEIYADFINRYNMV